MHLVSVLFAKTSFCEEKKIKSIIQLMSAVRRLQSQCECYECECVWDCVKQIQKWREKETKKKKKISGR